MAESTNRETQKTAQNGGEVTFVCQLCQEPRSIKEMRRVTRFRPVLVVCPDCETKLR